MMGVLRLLDGRHSVDEAMAEYRHARREIEAHRRAQFTTFGIPDDVSCPATRLYHSQSELNHGWVCPLGPDELSDLVVGMGYRRYVDVPRVHLPRTSAPLDVALDDAIGRRRSENVFADQPIDLLVLGELLRLSCGVTVDAKVPPRRAAPSAGGLYAIETYVVALAVDDLPAGVYHYATIEHELEQLRMLEGRSDLRAVLPPGLYDATPAVMVVLTAVLSRVQAKYLERGYRFALLEAGHVAQNLSLVSAALSLSATCLGGFCDGPMNRLLLGADDGDEVAVYAVLVGLPAAQETDQNRLHLK